MVEARAADPIRRSDILWLALGLLLIVATGIGLREPWPADEPRFALIARDMVASGDWLFPRVGGDLYADKPLVYFWLLALGYAITGSVRWSFLIPSFLSACGAVWLIFDFVRRLIDRRAALAAALTLLFTVQFVMVMRAAQIDATLFFFSTLSLYGLLRHLLFGPQWRWLFIGGLAAGIGVITKGVGFLPLLVLIPYTIMRARGFQPLPKFAGGWKWSLVAIGFLIGVSFWLVPMLFTVAQSGDPALIAYRDEILFNQTVHRYAKSWHHLKPWYFFLVEVIPGLWLPVSLLLIWLVPHWRDAWREKDARVWLPLAWSILVLVFFSCSPGKRGIYLTPALPGVVLAASPYLIGLFSRRSVQRTGLALSGLLVLGAIVLVVAHALGAKWAVKVPSSIGIASIAPFRVLAILGAIAWLWAWRTRPILAWAGVMTSVMLVWSYGINPQIDGERSARTFTQGLMRQVPPGDELALMGYKEQFLLYLDRPIVNFGHRRWLEGPKESYDAAQWLNGRPGRALLIPSDQLNPCFAASPRTLAGSASGENWLLVRAPASEDCARQGNAHNVIRYKPPATR
jgi:4-amino-4-deoxy-L-arabinose transferase-like glycosyltransferase